MRSTKKLAFLDRFYKRFCCGARNHPSGWKKEKHINRKATRRRLKENKKKRNGAIMGQRRESKYFENNNSIC